MLARRVAKRVAVVGVGELGDGAVGAEDPDPLADLGRRMSEVGMV
jgi:hypothetical protein